MLVLMLMTIGFCFNIKRNLPSTDLKAQNDAEFDAPETITAIAQALASAGHKVIEIEANEETYVKLLRLKNKIDIVFNIAEGFYGDSREAQIPVLCDILQIPYTHSSSLTQAITLDKSLTKKVLLYHGLPTPNFQLFHRVEEKLNPQLTFPLFIKPNAEGSSKGILNASLVKNKKTLYERIEWEIKEFQQPVLVEEFLPGREFTVSLLGNPPRVLPIIEQRLDHLPKKYAPFSSYEVKWLWEDTLTDTRTAYDCPAKINENVFNQIAKICVEAFFVLNCRDCARVDIRLDKNGTPFILEINTLPGMMPDKLGVSYFPISARVANYTYNEMVLAILNAALKRYKMKF